MRRESSTPDREEDYNFKATLRKKEHVIRGVVCKVWLPRRVTDPLVMRLYPRKRWQVLRSPFMIAGTIRDSGLVTTISATEVWTPTVTTRRHGKSRSETVVEANPVNLQIVEKRPHQKRIRGRVKVHTNYQLTPCPPIAPTPTISKSYTGEITIEDGHEFEFTLAGGAHLRFSNHYRYEDRHDGTLTYSHLVATHEHDALSRDFARFDEPTLNELDDFLALVGFGARYRAVCVGIDASSENADAFRFFRKNITLPFNEELSLNDPVIDRADFREFLRVTYERFIASGPDELLRHALYVVAPRGEQTGESEFTSLYAALESIALWYRRGRGLEFIVEDDDAWLTLQKDVRSFLEGHALLRGNEAPQKERRGMMYRKVGELRRVAFGTALEKFCSEYSVNLSDLWPVVDGKSGEVTLTDIRNRLVHGSTLTARQFHALIGAKEHMRWVVERALLGVFGWPVERSKVRPDFLARNFTAMMDLAQDRQDMKGPDDLPS